MDENNIFKEQVQPVVESGVKPKHTASLVLGVLSIVFAILFALVGDVLAIVGIILACVKKKEYNTKTGLILCCIGLVLAIANHIFSVLFLPQILSSLGV